MANIYERGRSTFKDYEDPELADQNEEIKRYFRKRFEDLAVLEALEYFHKYREIVPLTIEFRKKNEGIFRSDEAIELLEAAMLGKITTGKGRKKDLLTLERNYWICRTIYNLNKIGVPIKADENRNKQNACKLVGDKFHLSPAAVYSIWLKADDMVGVVKGHDIFEMFRPEDKPLQETVDYFYEQFTKEKSEYSQGEI